MVGRGSLNFGLVRQVHFCESEEIKMDLKTMVIIGDSKNKTPHCTRRRALVPCTSVRVHGHRGDRLRNCSLNVSAASPGLLPNRAGDFSWRGS